MTIHRIWAFDTQDRTGIVWFEKKPDGSFTVLNKYVAAGLPLARHVEFVKRQGIDPESIDYTPSDMTTALRRAGTGLDFRTLATPAWKSSTPFAEVSA